MAAILLALLPILAVLVLLFVLRQSSVRAGLAAYALAVVLAFATPWFPLGGAGLLHATVQGALIASLVAYVLLFGILLFHLMNETGLIRSIASFVAASTQDRVRQVLLLVVAFSPLVESASGFGIAILVIAPILTALGFDRFKATLLSLLSLSAVPWGALATGTVIGANLAGMSVQRIGTGSALLCAAPFLYLALLSVFVAGGWPALRRRGLETVVVAGSLAAGVYVFSTYVTVELAGVLGALVAIGVELAFLRFSAKKAEDSASSQVAATRADLEKTYSLGQAMSPYLFLTALLVLSRFVPFIETFLQNHAVISLSAYSFTLPLLFSPGFFLLLACLFTLAAFRISKPVLKKALRSAWKQWAPVTVSTIAYVAMAEVMAASGMTETLAAAAAGTFGSAFLILSPFLGGLGGFLTGSNTGANAMFIQLQLQTAHQLGLPLDPFAFAQNAGASHLTMASPSRVLLGVSVCGAQEEESRLLRTIALAALGTLVLLAIGVLAISSRG